MPAARSTLSGPLALMAAGCLAVAAAASAGTAPAAAQAASYTLDEKERGLDCKKLTGRMQVRILQMRNVPGGGKTTAVARGMQQAMRPVLGGTAHGSDPDGEYARDRAALEAYNRRLVELGCTSFDLDAALKPSTGLDTPRPTIPAKGKPSAKPAKPPAAKQP